MGDDVPDAPGADVFFALCARTGGSFFFASSRVQKIVWDYVQGGEEE